MKLSNFYSILFLLFTITWIACNNSTVSQHPAECFAPPEVGPAPESVPVPWVQVAESGEIFVLGKKTALEDIKPRLKAALIEMENIPKEIPPIYEGEVLMGTRHEIETQVAEILSEVAATKVIHGFYQWYLGGNSTLASIEFIKEKEGTLTLDLPKLDAYVAVLKNSGYVSETYLQNLKAYYQNCEALWQNESEGPYSCLEADLFTCSQDAPALLADHFTKAPISVTYLGEGLMVAKLNEADWEDEFELKLEKGKWLLTKFGCDL